jgi:D-alanine transfer protein
MPARLMAALIAVGLVILVLSAGAVGAHWTEGRYIHALASGLFSAPHGNRAARQPNLSILTQGSALQAEALRQPDLLPVYGSSELIWRDYQGNYNGSELFREYPTGFTIFPVAGAGASSLTILQELAAVGAELRDRKVAVSLSPSWLFRSARGDQTYYAGNFSPLHAAAFAFSTDLSLDLKQIAARRMLDYPQTLDREPLLRFALERLADPSPLSRALYFAALPLGKLETLVLGLQDHWETLALIRSQPNIRPEVPRRASPLDWPALLARATRIAEQRTRKRPLSDSSAEPSRGGRAVAHRFIQKLRQSTEWTDLVLLMRVLRELGARPLIVSPPLAGAYFDHLGVSRQARSDFYQKFRRLIEPYRVPVVDFANQDESRSFVADRRSHLSAEGWAYYDQALDAFYHDALGQGADPGDRRNGPADNGPRGGYSLQ